MGFFNTKKVTAEEVNFVCWPTHVLNDNMDHRETTSMEHDLTQGPNNNLI